MANKSETARINGSKSRGPVTPEGKVKSASNSLRHGLTAQFAVLPHEDKNDFEQLLDALVARYQPADEPETELVHALAVARWRLRRVGTLETCLFDNELAFAQDEIDEEFTEITGHNRLAYVFRRLAESGCSLELMMRYEASLMRVYERTLKQLEHLQNRPLRNEPTGSLQPAHAPDSSTTSRPAPAASSDPLPHAESAQAEPRASASGDKPHSSLVTDEGTCSALSPPAAAW